MASKQQVNPTIQREVAQHQVASSVNAILNILAQAESGDLIAQSELFADILERDAHISSEMDKRKLAVSQLEWTLQPSRDAQAREKKQIADFEQMIRDAIDIDTLIFEMMTAVGYGFSAHEIEWKRNAQGFWMPSQFFCRPQRWFTLDDETRQELRLRNNRDAFGEPLMPNGWIIHKHSSKTTGFFAQNGLLRALALPYLFKNFALKNWLRFCENYAVPIRVLFHHEKDDLKKRELMSALQQIGSSGVALLEGGTNEDFQTVDITKGEGQGFLALIDWCEKTASKTILGATLTSDTGKNGNYATANIHNEVRNEIRDFDARQIAETLTHQLIEAIARVNGLTIRAKWAFDTSSAEDFALFADAMPKLAAAGLDIPTAYLYEKLRIPLPKDGESILKVSQHPAQPTSAMTALSVETISTKFTPEQMVIENLADNLLTDLAAPLSNEQIQNVIRAAKSPEDLENRLALLMANADFSEFTKTLERALFAADVWGYASVRA